MASKANTRKIKTEPGIKQEHGQELATRLRSRRHRSWSSFLYNNVARLLIWYAILTALFRCPTSVDDLTPASPRICKPYMEARSFVSPYISPYYERYAAPYLQAARPYTDTFYFKVYTPAAGAAKQTYVKYGEPRVVQTQRFIQEEWDRSIRPRLDETKSMAQKQYDASLAPYVNQASEKVEPHLRNAQVIASRQYYSTILPTYRKSLPYFWLAYNRAHFVTVEYLYPYSRYGAEVTFDFLSKRIWPRLRIVYGENVEPQLVKIKERLANYRESQEIQSVVDDIDSSVQESKASSASSSSASKSVESKASTTNDATGQNTATGGKPTPHPSEEEEKAQITAELELWQEKFARASDKGAQELKARVEEITSRQIENQANGVGEALVTELDESVKTSFRDLKSTIIKSVRSIPDDAEADDIASAEEAAKVAIRRAGGTIKEKAQKLRSWRARFDEETTDLVKSATDSTLDVVDNIRDLGLQEIGMRWASMDTVTYQDWSKYHSLKKAVDKWRVNVESVALDHQGLTAAKQKSEDVESKGMAIAEEAAKELSRLKDVATWKIRADDSSDDFSSKAIPPIAVKLAQQAKSKFEDVSSAVVGTSQGTVESVSSHISESAESVMSDVSSKVEDQSMPSAASDVSSAVRSVASAASSKVGDPPLFKAASSASSALSSVSSAAASVASSVSSKAAQEAVSPASKSVARASKSAKSVASIVSESASSSSSSIDKETVSLGSKSASSAYSKASEEASSSVSSVSHSAASVSSSASDAVGSSASSASKSAASVASVAEQIVMSPASKVASSASSAASSMNTAERVKAASAEYAAKLAASASAVSASVSSAASSASASMPSVASSRMSAVSSDASSAASSVVDAASVSANTASASASSQSSELSASLSSKISKRSAEASSSISSASSKASSSASAKRPSSGFAMAQPDAGKGGQLEDDDDDSDSDSDDEKPPAPTNEAELDIALSEAMDRAKSHAASVTSEAFSKASSWKLPPGQASETDMAHQTADLINAAISMSKEIEKAATAASSEYRKDFLSSLESTKSSLASEASESSRRAAARPTEHPEL